MVDRRDFDTSIFPTWCPGCGNFGIWGAFKNALVELGFSPAEMMVVYGIGCSGNGADFLNTYGFHALHGRALPVATGAKLANHELKVVAMAGDGDGYGIGLGHFIHAVRRNLDLTFIVHNNQVYGLTTGQTSPTSDTGFSTKSTPAGVLEEPVNPVLLGVAGGASFVARGFAGDIRHLTQLFVEGIKHRGFALIDVFQPCVTFNKVNTYDWFRERIYKLDTGQTFTDRGSAMKALGAHKDRLATGVIYREEKPTYEDGLDQLKDGPLVGQNISDIDISEVLARFT